MDHSRHLQATRHALDATSAAKVRSGKARIRAARPQPEPLPTRRSALSRVLPFWPQELDDQSLPARRRVVERLRRALRAERRRGLAGHWTYDLARHVELLRLYRAELEALSGAGAHANPPHRL